MSFMTKVSVSALALTVAAGAAFAQDLTIENADWWAEAGALRPYMPALGTLSTGQFLRVSM